jgi:hypothetical protein
MRKAIRGALGKRAGPSKPRPVTAGDFYGRIVATVSPPSPSPAEELLSAEPMEVQRAAFIKAAIESVAVYHSLNGYADSQSAFFSVMKREGYDVLKWLAEKLT